MAVAWPSAFQGGRVWLYTEWPWRVTVSIGNVAAIGAGLLAALLAWRSEDPAAPHLAAALGIGALAFGIGSDPVLPEISPFLNAILDASVLATAVLAGAAFMRFSVLFPIPLTMERIRALGPLGAGPDNPLQAPEAQLPIERSGARIAHRMREWVKDRSPRRMRELGAGVGASRKRLLARLAQKTPASLQKEMQSDFLGVLHRTAARAWRYGAIIAAGSIVLVLLGAYEAADLVTFVLVLPVFWGWALLRISYAAGGQDERRKILWILQGFMLLIGIPGLVTYGLMVPTLFSHGARLLMLKLLLPAMALGALAMVICLAIAVFWAGALDPGRALRSTVVYGGLGLVLTVVFALMENVASDYVVGWVGLPGNYAVVVSTAVTAVTFSALHHRFERMAGGLFGGAASEDEAPSPAASALHGSPRER